MLHVRTETENTGTKSKSGSTHLQPNLTRGLFVAIDCGGSLMVHNDFQEIPPWIRRVRPNCSSRFQQLLGLISMECAFPSRQDAKI